MKLTHEENIYFAGCAAEILSSETVRSMDRFMQHGGFSTLQHSISVAYYSYWLCRRLHLKVDARSLIRGALLHDLFLYDWHIHRPVKGLHGLTHPYTALRNAQRLFALNETERDIIVSHMWPLTGRVPRRRETAVVCAVDKWRAVAEMLRLAKKIDIIAVQ